MPALVEFPDELRDFAPANKNPNLETPIPAGFACRRPMATASAPLRYRNTKLTLPWYRTAPSFFLGGVCRAIFEIVNHVDCLSSDVPIWFLEAKYTP